MVDVCTSSIRNSVEEVGIVGGNQNSDTQNPEDVEGCYWESANYAQL